MKPAVLQFQRNRVERQPSDAASTDIVKTIVELRSALHRIKKAITAVERVAIIQYGEDALKPRKPVVRKKRTPSPKPKIHLVAFPHAARPTEVISTADPSLLKIKLDSL